MRRIPITLVLCCLLALPAPAQTPADTLGRIAETGHFRIGFVPDAAPLSFRDASGEPAGYSIDLCRLIAARVQRQLGLEEMEIDFVPLVMPAERAAAVASAKVDIECGASTITLDRREQVDFTLMTLITGASSLSLAKTGIRTNADLNGRSIAVAADTTTEAALADFLGANEFVATVVKVPTHEAGLALLDRGEVDAYVSDQTILLGHVIAAADPADYRLAPDVFSFEPYGFMVRKDDSAFRLVADRALAEAFRTPRIQRLYQTWFGRYGIPQSPALKAMYQFEGFPR